MNAKHIYQIANLTQAVYRIAYTSFLLYWLVRERRPPPIAPEPQPRRYH